MNKQRKRFEKAIHALVRKSGGDPGDVNARELFNTGLKFGYLVEVDGPNGKHLPIDTIRCFEAELFRIFSQYYEEPIKPRKWVVRDEDPEYYEKFMAENRENLYPIIYEESDEYDENAIVRRP